MVTGRACRETKTDGSSCGMPPLRDSDFCLSHDPDHVQEAQEARRLGGQRRRRERIVSGAYEVSGLRTIEDIRRILEIATLDALGLENSIARNRLLVSIVPPALKLIEVGEMDERLEAIEAVLGPRLPSKGPRR